ncbi:methyltransferase [Chloropicon primus]|uniref:Methyltransferase n=1 Tax=Chloropicon primus TaxID=1764295 RepID=A0A5B8MRW4_9CHLO|nr:methyltransferase [Chloropicon primus]UPR02235.1 methyltransferase [Chloropicon primus]|mmetsp:Transcript_3312/g.9243  ORF Transcript_3312/g.9243 Transcript_3312/m.9243 type:complete len:214 (-) Transcript_3312:52-693(-)|eukprot:QDZ23017.1 methyltransferase [Chloropicon primus]
MSEAAERRAVPFGDSEYWVERYEREAEDGFEWYPGAESIVCEELSHLTSEERGWRWLEIGSGSSALASKLAGEHSSATLCVSDVAPNVVATMKERLLQGGAQNLEFAVLDATSMKCIRSESMDLVFDKGTLDAIDCLDHEHAGTSRCLSEVRRVLNPGGSYLLVSCREPEGRRRDFELGGLRLVKTVEIKGVDPRCPCPDAYLFLVQKAETVP